MDGSGIGGGAGGSGSTLCSAGFLAAAGLAVTVIILVGIMPEMEDSLGVPFESSELGLCEGVNISIFYKKSYKSNVSTTRRIVLQFCCVVLLFFPFGISTFCVVGRRGNQTFCVTTTFSCKLLRGTMLE